jgi:hypothetical protein
MYIAYDIIDQFDVGILESPPGVIKELLDALLKAGLKEILEIIVLKIAVKGLERNEPVRILVLIVSFGVQFVERTESNREIRMVRAIKNLSQPSVLAKIASAYTMLSDFKAYGFRKIRNQIHIYIFIVNSILFKYDVLFRVFGVVRMVPRDERVLSSRDFLQVKRLNHQQVALSHGRQAERR